MNQSLHTGQQRILLQSSQFEEIAVGNKQEGFWRLNHNQISRRQIFDSSNVCLAYREWTRKLNPIEFPCQSCWLDHWVMGFRMTCLCTCVSCLLSSELDKSVQPSCPARECGRQESIYQIRVLFFFTFYIRTSALAPDAWLSLITVSEEGRIEKGHKPSLSPLRIESTKGLFGCFFWSRASFETLIGENILNRWGCLLMAAAATGSE